MATEMLLWQTLTLVCMRKPTVLLALHQCLGFHVTDKKKVRRWWDEGGWGSWLTMG